MKLIDEICQDLKTAAVDVSKGKTSKQEFNLMVDLLIARVDRIEINFVGTGIRSDKKFKKTTADVQPIFKQLLFQRKYRAVEALKELQQPEISKRVFNQRVRKILAAKLFFGQLETTVRRTMVSYHEKNGGYILEKNIQLFIEGGTDHE